MAKLKARPNVVVTEAAEQQIRNCGLVLANPPLLALTEKGWIFFPAAAASIAAGAGAASMRAACSSEIAPACQPPAVAAAAGSGSAHGKVSESQLSRSKQCSCRVFSRMHTRQQHARILQGTILQQGMVHCMARFVTKTA